MKELEYPFDSSYILKKRKKLKRELLENGQTRIKKKIAVLGGATVDDIVSCLELFLLDNGIEPVFYKSEYNMYWEDAVFGGEIDEFEPDVVYIHTSIRNLRVTPAVTDSGEQVESKLRAEYERFEQMWQKLYERFSCVIIQDNFAMPYYRLLGNSDVYDIHGLTGFVGRFNEKIYSYARGRNDFFVLDINYLSACVGLDRWYDLTYWYLYKYAQSLQAIPALAFEISKIIKAVFGKNKKCIALDLDNTLWGGIVGDDGVEGIKIGHEDAQSESYYEFQSYIKAHKDIGVILSVCSKNEHENAIAGLEHPEGVLRPDDFIVIKANWEPKSENIKASAAQIGILTDSFVFVDDNPAEREIVSKQTGAVAPDIGEAADYIRVLDRSGFFEVTRLSKDDLKRNEMYKANAKRNELQSTFADYGEYLDSLEMTAVIRPFEKVFFERISQLTNKSNQFNLTTLRCSVSDIASFAQDENYVTLYGSLKDKFGDNGVVSIVAGRKKGDEFDITLWLMSCRVLKRDMELAMLDSLVGAAKKKGIKTLRGLYIPTAKNKMVKDFYDGVLGFEKTRQDDDGQAEYTLDIEEYENKNIHIDVKE